MTVGGLVEINLIFSRITRSTTVLRSSLIAKSPSKTLPRHLRFGRISYLMLHHRSTPSTHIHMQRGGLFFLCSSLDYFFQNTAFFPQNHLLLAYLFSLACCQCLCKPLHAFPKFRQSQILTSTANSNVFFPEIFFGRATKCLLFSLFT